MKLRERAQSSECICAWSGEKVARRAFFYFLFGDRNYLQMVHNLPLFLLGYVWPDLMSEGSAAIASFHALVARVLGCGAQRAKLKDCDAPLPLADEEAAAAPQDALASSSSARAPSRGAPSALTPTWRLPSWLLALLMLSLTFVADPLLFSPFMKKYKVRGSGA